jgi:ABC-2 type transport system ATP-binding protein
MSLLSIQNVVKRYQQHTALSGVSLEIPHGQIFGLLGPNGAGKTSLIRIINQITMPDEGRILLNGAPMRTDDVHRIGYLPEERGLYKKMKIGEQALYLAKLKGMSSAEANRRIKIWFEKFELQPWWNKKVEELSKGMQQKVQFICTVLHEPELIILDEPFSGFDPINAEMLKQEILAMKAKGATIIFSTHRMESVEELCDHIALINQSKVVLNGATREIKKQFSTNTYRIGFGGSLPALPAGYELIDEKPGNDWQEARIQVTNGSANELLTQLLPQITLHRFEEEIPSFNEIFIRTVKNAKA